VRVFRSAEMIWELITSRDPRFDDRASNPWRKIVFNPWSAYLQLAQAAWDTNIVVAMRLMRLASGGALAQREAQRMIVEKGFTFAEAQFAAATRMMAGAGIAGATRSATDVYRRKVRKNRRRLVR
jgi:hypothetical protein